MSLAHAGHRGRGAFAPAGPERWAARRTRRGSPGTLANLLLTPLPVVVLALATAWTILIVLTPIARFDVLLPGGRVPLETTGVVFAFLAAALAYLKYSLSGARTALLISIALVILGINHFMFTSLARVSAQQREYSWMAGRMFVAFLLLVAAVGRFRHPTEAQRPLLDFLRSCGVLVGVLTAVQLLLWVLREHLPSFSSAVIGGAEATPGVGAGLTAVDIVVGALGAAMFLVAAWAFLRSPERSEGLSPWLSAALVLAAFCQIHYMLMPALPFGDRISTGDLLRVGFSVTLLIGLLRDVRSTYLAEHDRAHQLASAYEAEHRRVEQLEDLERKKAELMEILTHELGHPVATIRAWVHTLVRQWPDLEESSKLKILESLDAESSRLRDLAEETSRIMAPQPTLFPISPSPEPVLGLLRDAAMLAPELRGRLRVIANRRLSRAAVMADRTRILQVFRNLLSNVAKFANDGGTVELHARAMGKMVEFSVSDRGSGFSREAIAGAFEGSARAGAPDGSGPKRGIGLYVCYRIVQAHGGRIGATSEVNEGSTIRFTLPLAPATQQQP